MSDIVQRLRELHADMHLSIGAIASEAADEIERLRAPIGKPIAEAPRDGEEQAFEIKFNTRAFWDKESKRWVLSYPLNMEYLPSHSRYLGPARVTAAVGQQSKP